MGITGMKLADLTVEKVQNELNVLETNYRRDAKVLRALLRVLEEEASRCTDTDSATSAAPN